MLSEFDYFVPTSVQASILDEYDEMIAPSTALSAGSTIDFLINGMPNIYRDLSNSYLEVQCKVTNTDGTNLADDAAVAPVNLLLHSMFSSVDVHICGKRITENDTLYPYRAFIETLLTYPTDVLDTRAKLAGWCLDKDAAAMDRLLLATAGGTDPSAQFLQRNRAIAGSRVYTLVGRPHADIFHQNLDIPPGCDISITLTPSESKFALLAAATATFKLVITGAKLYVRSKEVAPELILAHRAMLSRCDFRIPFTRVEVRKFQIATGTAEHSINNLFNKKLPKRIVVGLVTQARVVGGYNLNPFKFHNFGLTKVDLKVGGNSVPREVLSMDYAAEVNNYGRAYLNTLAALGLDIGTRAISLTPELWASAYNLYAFKLVPGPIDDGPVESLRASSTVNLTLTFSAGLTAPVEVIIYSETNALLSITSLNNAIIV